LRQNVNFFAHRLPQGLAFINGDDAMCLYSANLYQDCFLFGFSEHNQFHGLLHGDKKKVVLTINFHQYTFTVDCPTLIGKFNGYNILAAIAVALYYGGSSALIQEALGSFTSVRGRFERHNLPDGVTIIIDYAHNPASYQMVLPVLRDMTDHLIVLFGAGGQRDRAKRPLMGHLAALYADILILTSDNPREEDPQEIIKDIFAGIPVAAKNKVFCIVDRYQAIESAYKIARFGSVIALLGKGAESYQFIGSAKVPFSEAIIIEELPNSCLKV